MTNTPVAPWILTDVLLPASPVRVYDMLTSERELLRWYSAEAKLASVDGAIGRFEGKDGVFLESWQVLAHGPASHLEVLWHNEADSYEGLRLRVRLDLGAEAGGGCRLRAVASEGSGPAVEAGLQEWRLALSRLSALLQAEADIRSVVQSASVQVALPQPRARLWQALTDAAELCQWFWDDAAIDLRPGGAFHFRVPGQEDADRGTVVAVVPQERIEFDWHAAGQRSRVVWSVDDQGWSVLDGPHQGPDAWRRSVCQVGWRCVQQSLEAWLTADPRLWDRAAWLAGMGFRETRHVTLPLDRVWQAWTSPADLAGWLGWSGGWTDENPSRLLLTGAPGWRAVSLQIAGPERLVWRWDVNGVPTIVSVRLSAGDQGTDVHLHHWGFLGLTDAMSTEHAFWLDRLQALEHFLVPPGTVTVAASDVA